MIRRGLGQGHQQAQGRDQLHQRGGGPDPPEEQPVEDHADQRSEDQDGDHPGRPPGPAVLDQEDEGQAGHEGLGPEGQVEDARRLVGEDQAHRHQGEDAAEGDPGHRVVEELDHPPGTPGCRGSTSTPPLAVGRGPKQL